MEKTQFASFFQLHKIREKEKNETKLYLRINQLSYQIKNKKTQWDKQDFETRLHFQGHQDIRLGQFECFKISLLSIINKNENVQSKTARQVCDRENILATNKFV